MRNELLLLLSLLGFSAATSAQEGSRLNIGQPLTELDAQQRGVSIFPDGTGLPIGRGTAKEGAVIYAEKCSACHGGRGEGREEYPALVGGRGSLSSEKPVLTVGSYWPTATTIFDYIWRAMPYTAPGSLTADETYALTAWLLSENEIVGPTSVIDRKTLLKVKMPNGDGFITGSIAKK